MVEFHPIAGIFDKPGEAMELPIRYPYFPTGEPLFFEEDGTYADRSAKLEHRATYSWPHPTSNVISALIDSGLHIEFFHEFPFSVEPWWSPLMEEAATDTFRLIKHGDSIPLMFSIKATKLA